MSAGVRQDCPEEVAFEFKEGIFQGKVYPCTCDFWRVDL